MNEEFNLKSGYMNHGRSGDFFRGGGVFPKKFSKNFVKIVKKFPKNFQKYSKNFQIIFLKNF